MNIDQLLFSLAPVTALVGTSIYAVVLPRQPSYPAIVYQIKSLVPQEQGASTAGMLRMRLLLSSFSPDYAPADAIRQALMANLIGFTGAVGSDYIQSSQLIDANDNFEPEIEVHRLSLEVQLLY